MRPVKFDLAIKRGMTREPAPGADAGAGPSAASDHTVAPEPRPFHYAPPPEAPRKLWRRIARRLAGPITEHARRYLSQPNARRIEVLEARIVALAEQAAHLERLMHQNQRELEAGQRALTAGSVQLEARQRDLAVAAKQDLATAQLQLDAAQALRQTALFAHVDARIDGLAGMFGPRFDELEIKARPLIDIDAETIAVRMGDGYVMAPRSQPLFVLMLADATTGGLEPGTRKVLKKLIVPGMNVADVGANVGLLTLVCARATGPAGKVWSFEPEPSPRGLAEKMRQANGLGWVDLRDTAVGRETGTLTFNVSPIIGHSSLYDLPSDEMAASTQIKVHVEPLDQAIGADARLDVVKIDVEGAELDVLAGMQGLKKANRDLAFVVEYGPSHLERVGLSRKAWFKAFQAGGYSAYAISEETGEVTACSADSLGDVMSVNIAFVRKSGAAAKRLGVA